MGKGSPIARLFVRLELEKGEFNRGARDARRETKGLVRSMNNVRGGADLMTGALQAAGVLGLGYMAREAAEAAWQLGIMGAEALRTETSFERLSGRIGETGASLMGTMRRASDNTVSDMVLMQETAGLLASGINTSSGEIALALDIAQLKAQQFGLSTSEAYSRMVTGARKFSVEMLDELGITIRAENAYKRKALALGKTAKALTDAERAESLWAAILEDGREELELHGGAVQDYVTDIEAAQTAIANASTELQKALAPAVAAVAEEVPGVLNRLELLAAGIGGQISAEEAWTAAAEAQRIEQERGIAAAQAYVKEVIRQGEVVQLATNVHGDFKVALDATADATDDATDAVGDFSDAYGTMMAKMQGGGGLIYALDTEMEMLKGKEIMQGVLDEQAEENARKEEDRNERIKQAVESANLAIGEAVDARRRATEDAIAAEKRAYDDLRSTIQSALRATRVTPLDMGLSDSGGYEEKWDENARRLDAVAARGFAELDAHPDWAGMLKIPPEVLAAGEAALKDWAGRTAGAVRNLERPDLLNVDAALQAVQDELNRKAAVELSLDLVTNAAMGEGLVSGPDAKSQVAQMLGLEAGPVQLPYQLVPMEEEGEGGGGLPVEALTEQFMGGVELALDRSQMMSTFVASLDGDIKAHRSHLTQSGTTLWQAVEVGIWTAMHSSEYVIKFAKLIAPEVARIIIRDERWTEE